MKQLAAGFFFLLAATFPAQATGTISCRSSEDAAIQLQLGFVAVDSVIGAYISVGASSWSTRNDDKATPIAILQSFIGNGQLLVDFGDENLENIVARLRLFRAESKVDMATAGTLEIAGVGVYPVVCEGP